MRALLTTVLLAATVAFAPAAPVAETPERLDAWLETQRARHHVPAVAVAVVRQHGVVAWGVAGRRIMGLPEPVQLHDRFQLASLTKPFTATTIARLVEQGVIAWDTRVLDALPELEGRIHRAYGGATLAQLLSHQARVPAFTTGREYAEVAGGIDASLAAHQQRLAFVGQVLRRAPTARPGAQLYSNAGYTVATAMVERRAGQPWESLVEQQLLQPLGITTAGYGWPGAKHIAPWGHYHTDIGLLPYPPDGRYQFAGGKAALAAGSGALYMSIPDAARLAHLHLRGLRGQPQLLSAESLQRLHAPVGRGDFALGWERRGRGIDAASFHDGNTGMTRAWMVVVPGRNVAVVVATTADFDGAEALGDTLVELLLDRFGTP